MSEARSVLELAIRLARAAGRIQRDRYESALTIETKSSAVDLVTEVDRECERIVVEGIGKERPGDAVVAEEGNLRAPARAGWRWIVDPLDGTTNYAHGYPRFCVSIGVERAGEPCVAVVYDPLLDELYQAVRGEGAFRNGAPIRVSAEPRLDRGLVATGFAYDRRASDEDNAKHFFAFLKAARAVRRDGSAALDLCYVAAGRLDGYWEFKLSPWDVAAGSLLVEEAGGRCSDASGGPDFRSGEQIVASNGLIHAAVLEVLRRSR